MSRYGPPSALPEQDYDAIEAAVMETARGRWFLAEYARRNRTADTEMLLAAIAKLEAAINDPSTDTSGFGQFRGELMEMANAIAQTKREIAAMQPTDGSDGRIGEATGELDAIVESTEKATSEILYACEQIQEIAWTARENGANPAACDAIDAHVTEIYTACSFQDLTGQRTQKVVKVLRFIENRLNAMMHIWDVDASHAGEVKEEMDRRPDAHLLNGPQLAGKGKSQDEVNSLLDGEEADIDDIVFASAADAADAFEAVHADAAPEPEAQPHTDPHAPASEIAEETGEIIHEAEEPDPAPAEIAAAPEVIETAETYDLAALEKAAEQAVDIGDAASFDAFPRDEAPPIPPIGTQEPTAPELQQANPVTARDEAVTVTVPSLHELAFSPQHAAATQPETGRGSARAAEQAFGAIATELERGASPAQPSAVIAPDDTSDDPFAKLSAAQRMALFS